MKKNKCIPRKQREFDNSTKIEISIFQLSIYINLPNIRCKLREDRRLPLQLILLHVHFQLDTYTCYKLTFISIR